VAGVTPINVTGTPPFDVAEKDELSWVLHRQCAKEHVVDQAEDGRVRADAKGQCEYHHGCEAAVLEQPAER
jgi:hypothetical protein